jgi:hemerythrin-like domain-containing protein
MATGVSLPGFESPAVGFEQPFEMLHACHDRVQRMLTLLQRLRGYLHERASDDVARQAARDVMRYFDQAAPLHHQDEELHVFPPLLAQGGPEVVALVRQLQRDHVCMAADWAAARVPLQALAAGEIHAFTAEQEALFDRFAGRYADHIRHEECRAYPAAQRLLGAEALAPIGQEMARRRGAR